MNNISQELLSWLALNNAPGLSNKKLFTLLQNFKDVSKIFNQPDKQYHLYHLEPETIAFLQSPPWEDFKKDLAWVDDTLSQFIITFNDDRYPPLLKEIAHPPPLLYIKGNPELLKKPQIAIIGSRNPSSRSKETAALFAHNLSEHGFIITSGLALGIDTSAHRGALKAHQTIGVLGTGIDIIYPKTNHLLFQDIAQKGCIVSEFSLGTAPYAYNFPRRNRIISGLSLGTLVVEAALQSGSLITAQFALEQGREVFAIPGSIHNPLARGTHQLIRQGAKLVETVEDVLEELTQFYPKISSSVLNKPPTSQNILEESYIKLLECIDYEPTHIDILVERSKLSIQKVSTLLMNLEMQGYIFSTLGGYTRVS